MSKSFKWILLALAGLVVLVLIAKMLRSSSPAGTKVTAEMVRRQTITETVTATGKIYPEVEVKISPDISGEVTDLNVAEGDSVKQGQVLARISGSNSRQQAGIPGLPGLQLGSSSPGRTTVTAPMDGIISMLGVKKGERVVATAQMAGTEMMRVADLSRLEVRVAVDENQIVKVAVGDSAAVTVEAYNNRKFGGVVTQIAVSTTKAGPVNLPGDVTAYEVHIRLTPASYADLFDAAKPRQVPFRPGMNATAEITTLRKTNIIAVPTGAVTARAKGSDKTAEDQKKETQKATGEENAGETDNGDLETVVYVVNADDKVEKRVVTTGIQDIKNIEIKSGLKEGERLVTGPFNAVSQTLKTGKKIVVVTQDQLF